MAPSRWPETDAKRIRDQFREASRELDEVIDQATRLLSGLSHNVAIAIAPSRDTHAFKHVQLLWLSARTRLIVIVTSMGVAAQEVVEMEDRRRGRQFTRLSNALNAVLGGQGDGRHPRRRHRPRVRERRGLGRNPARAAVGVSEARPPDPQISAGRRAELARSARISRPAQATVDPPNCRRTKGALRSHRRTTSRTRPIPRTSTSARNSVPTKWPNAASSPCRIASATAAWACSRFSGRGACRTDA